MHAGRAFAALAALVALATAAAATPPDIILQARYTEPTTRYDHGILGDNVEWGALELTVDTCTGCQGGPHIRTLTIRLPENRVFEDTAPRLIELPDRAGPVVMVVETDLEKGARLALYDESGLMAATPFIGRTNRWLAPLGVADLDGDGQVEIAYVDRPHLAKIIRIWRYREGGELVPVAELPGYTNHRIGEPEISGGIRDCGQGPEMIVADAGWQNLFAVTFSGIVPIPRRLGPIRGEGSFARAMACKHP